MHKHVGNNLMWSKTQILDKIVQIALQTSHNLLLLAEKLNTLIMSIFLTTGGTEPSIGGRYPLIVTV